MKVWHLEQGDVYHGDCLKVMRRMKAHGEKVGLVCGSPPYEAQRTYDELEFTLKGQDWVDWMVEVFLAALDICDGMVAFVVGHGVTEKFRWSATPALLCADLHREGVNLWDPKAFMRNGIPGSGGTQNFRKDFEWVVCATHGKLPWADPTACGRKPKYGSGGKTSHRKKDGTRVEGRRIETDVANPGSVIKTIVGGGHLGSKIAEENDAPYPEVLPDRFVRSFCPPGETVLDPFCGSGTTLSVAVKTRRRFIGIDLRESQVKLSLRRVKQANFRKGFGL